MKIFTLVRDTFYESRKKKVFWLLLVLSTLTIVVLGGVGFNSRDYPAVFEQQTNLPGIHQLASNVRSLEFGELESKGDGTWEVEVSASHNVPVVDLRPRPDRQTEREWLHFLKYQGDNLGRQLQRVFLTSGHEEVGFKVVSSEVPAVVIHRILEQTPIPEGIGPIPLKRAMFGSPSKAGPREVIRLELRPGDTSRMTGGSTLTLLYGLIELDQVGGVSGPEVVAQIQILVAELVAGWIGIIIALLFTAGFVPSMINEGQLQLLLSKQLSRWEILLGKYLGGIAFVAFHAAYLVLGLWVVLSLNAGTWNMLFPLSILSVVGLFAILYAVSVLAGIVWENTIISIVLSIGFWLVCSGVATARGLLKSPGLMSEGASESMWVKLVDAIYWVLPNTSALSNIATYHIHKEVLNPATRHQLETALEMTSTWGVIVSTSLFTMVVLVGAVALFYQKDY